MLKTSIITRMLKESLNNNGYNYVSSNMKLVMLKDELNNSICEELEIKNRGEYTLTDVIDLLDCKTKLQGNNREIFSSYINSIINIIGEIQGSVISWNQTDDICEYITEFKYDENGFVQEIKSNKKAKLSSVLIDIIKKTESKQTSKLLMK